MSEITHEIDANFAGRLNILRAGVLGANDGIISNASIKIHQRFIQIINYC